jgi:oligopeptide/dipeptide ABC transporter ATP-binding protein
MSVDQEVRAADAPTGGPLLSVRDISVTFNPSTHRAVRAVDHVSFDVERGSTFGIIGESGSGKSTLARAIIGLAAASGEVLLDGEPILGTRKRMKPGPRRVQMVVQDPHASLDPRMTIGKSVAEPLRVAGVKPRSERMQRAAAMLERVGLSSHHLQRYPHEMSGGQKQRASIARALIAEPDLLICDESVSSLDVALQAEILNLLDDLRRAFGITVLFISHDLGVVGHLADRVGVMYLGRLVEIGDTEPLISACQHPYTRALIDSKPTIAHAGKPVDRIKLTGEIPSALNPPSGCHFRTRCPYARDRCREERPELRAVVNGSAAACHFAEELTELWSTSGPPDEH